jgi:hypothetical protein
VHEERFGDLIADTHHRIQRRHRLLKNERDARAAHPAHLRFRERKQIAPLEHHTPAGDSPWWLEETQDRERRDRFAAA